MRAFLLVLSAGVLIASTAPARAQPAGAPVTVYQSAAHELTAPGGAVYRVYIRTPASPAPAAGFPVVYILDGDWWFAGAASTAVIRGATNDLPQAVIVGIGFAGGADARLARMRAFTSHVDRETVHPSVAAQTPEFGGAEEFRAFLLNDVRRFVAERAPIDRRCQTLIGHSLGGMFVLETLFKEPESFQRFVAASPAIQWNEEGLRRLEEQFAGRVNGGEVNAKLWIPVASGEAFITARAAPLGARLVSLSAGSFEAAYHVFEGETHNSVVAGMLSRALTFGLDCAAP